MLLLVSRVAAVSRRREREKTDARETREARQRGEEGTGVRMEEQLRCTNGSTMM
jgi:hypothetical protein